MKQPTRQPTALRISLACALAGLALPGCSVMHFKNGAAAPKAQKYEKWHHNVAFSLWEVSAPVNLATLCPNGAWARVTTKETFLTGLAGTADQAVTAPLTTTTVSEDDDSEVQVSFGVDIWDPQMVEYTCAE